MAPACITRKKLLKMFSVGNLRKMCGRVNPEVGFGLTKAKRDILHLPNNSQSQCLQQREANLPGVHIISAELSKH